MAVAAELTSRPSQPDLTGPHTYLHSSQTGRSRPDAPNTIEADSRITHNKIQKTAYWLYRTRELTAEQAAVGLGGTARDLRTAADYKTLPPEERQRRDWLHAESLVHTGNPDILAAVEQRVIDLEATSPRRVAKVAYTLFELRRDTGEVYGQHPDHPIPDRDLPQWDWEVALTLVGQPEALEEIYSRQRSIALAA